MPWPVNARTSAMLDELQALCGFPITVTQGSPSTSDPTSAGTHAGEGVFDAVGADLDVMVVNGRKIGFAIWHRTPAQGFPHHVHGVAVGEPLLSSQAQAQVDSYLAGYNGLRGNGVDDGPRDWVGITWETYSGGTYVPPTGGDPVIIYGQFPGDRSGSYGDFPGGILAGTPSFTGGSTFYLNDIDDPPTVTLHLDAGDSCMLAILEDWAYYQQEEDLGAGYYLIRGTGGGTFAVADAWDTYAYPAVTPTWVPQTSLGTVDGFAYFTASPDLLDLSHLYNDGWPLIRLTCTSGSVDITWAGMQIQPASGYYAPDAGWHWSTNQAPSTAEPDFDTDTYVTYDDAGVEKWVVDDTKVQTVEPVSGGPGYDSWSGYGESTTSALAARLISLGDFGPETVLSVTVAIADLVHVPLGGPIFPIAEHWEASLVERVTTFTAPTKAVLPPEPAGFLAIPEYLRLGPSEYEWLGDDTSLLGWHIHEGNVGFTGDTDTFTLYLTDVVDEFDTSTDWYSDEDDDIVILEQEMPDVGPPPVDPELIPIPDTFYSTTTQFIARRLTLAREQTNQTSAWTPAAGYPAGVSGTTVQVDENNVVRARFSIPAWRYKIPTFVSVLGPPPFIDFDEDPTVTYLRNRQRNDGLGGWSTPRAKGTSSRQLSLHNRGYE